MPSPHSLQVTSLDGILQGPHVVVGILEVNIRSVFLHQGLDNVVMTIEGRDLYCIEPILGDIVRLNMLTRVLIRDVSPSPKETHLCLHKDSHHLRTPMQTRQVDQVLGLETEAAPQQMFEDLDLVVDDHHLDEAVDVAAPDTRLYLAARPPVVHTTRTVHDVISHTARDIFWSPLHILILF